MPDQQTGTLSGAPLVDAARLPKSYANTYAFLAEAVRLGATFFGLPGMGITQGQGKRANPDTFVKDFSPDEVIVGCYGRAELLSASYAIDGKGVVTFGEPFAVVEQFVPLAGDEMTDALALTDAEVEVLCDGTNGSPRRLRLLSSKANTVINKRVYPMTLVRPAIALLKPKAKSGMVYTETPHPAAIRDSAGKVVGFRSNPSKRVSRVVNVEVNDKGEVWTEHEFLATPLAATVYESFVSRSGKFGISQRAIGELETQALAGGPQRIAKTLEIHTYDFVENPALNETVSRFEVLLDDALGAIAPASPPSLQPPTTPTAQAVASEKEFTTMGDENLTPAIPAATPAQPVPVAATLSAEQAEALQEAMAILKADKASKALEVTRAAVKAVVASEAPSYFTGIPEQFQASIVAKAEAAPSAEAAVAVLSDETDRISTMQAIVKANGMGVPAIALGVTTPTEGAPTVGIQVTGNPTPHIEFFKKFGEAYDEHRYLMSNGDRPNESLRKVNKPFVDDLIRSMERGNGKALLDSAEALLDDAGDLLAFTDSTSTSNLWNQPTITTALLIQQFQDMEMLQFVGGIGPQGFEQQSVNGQIGSVLKVPVEYYSAPAGSLSLPGYDNSLFVGEDVTIPEGQINTNWLTFAPQWRRIAASLTRDAERGLKNGPLKYQALARVAYHLVEDKKRRIDRALGEEMLAISDEYQAVAVATEAVIAANLIQNTAGTQIYGAGVTWYANLIGAGTSAAPNRNPLVRPRTNTTLTSQGQLTSSVVNAITVSVPAAQVQGYLDANGNIQSFPGGSVATYAVDFVNGRVAFNAASTVNGTTLPTVGYTYVTNFDVFSLTVPGGVEPSLYYNRLLEQIDRTAALMGSFPRFMKPNLILGSLMACTRITNAQTFYKWQSPVGTDLFPSKNFIAERNGKMVAEHNTPWSAGDSRLLLTRRGSTKYGVDTPFEIEGPIQKQNNGALVDTKLIYGAENSVICTPQVTDQAGNVMNPVARSIFLR
jgi:hypothetical protein